MPDSNPRPQFGLRMVFVLVTILCVLLALARLVSPYVLGILVLLFLTVGAHLAASGMGHRLQLTFQRRRHRGRPGVVTHAAADTGQLQPADFAPTTRLSIRSPLGRIVVIAPVLGGAVGMTVGGIGMSRFLAEKATLANVAVAAIAAGVLGAIGSFLTATFIKALWEANAEASRHESSGRAPEERW